MKNSNVTLELKHIMNQINNINLLDNAIKINTVAIKNLISRKIKVNAKMTLQFNQL